MVMCMFIFRITLILRKLLMKSSNLSRTFWFQETSRKNRQCFLIIEQQIITDIQKNAALVLIAAYYVYNLKFPKGWTNFYTLLEVLFLRKPSAAPNASVKHLLSSLNL